MQIEWIDTPKAKTWGVIPIPGKENHFHTGYEGVWQDGGYSRAREIGEPYSHMQIGRNVIITGDLRITGWSRGRSAANFNGTFRDHPDVTYELSMDGMGKLIALMQDQPSVIAGGYIRSRWTFVKQGQNIFIVPLTAA